MKKWQKAIIITFCVLILLGMAMFLFIKFVLVPKAADIAIETAVTYMIPDEYVASELIEAMETEDRDFVEDILVDYALDKEARETIMSLYDNNDYTGIKDYAIQNLSPEQMDQALEIAEKYSEFLPPEGQAMIDLYLKQK